MLVPKCVWIKFLKVFVPICFNSSFFSAVKKIFILTNQKYTKVVIEMETTTHDLNLNLLKLKFLLHW